MTILLNCNLTSLKANMIIILGANLTGIKVCNILKYYCLCLNERFYNDNISIDILVKAYCLLYNCGALFNQYMALVDWKGIYFISVPQSHLGERRKQSKVGREGGREGPGTESGLGPGCGRMWGWSRTWSGIRWRKRTKILRASRKSGNRQPQEIGGWGEPPECTGDLGGERTHREGP
jgi:hypothetical protein